MALFAAFGGGYISGTKEMPYWLQLNGDRNAEGKYILSTANDSLVTSILSAGTFTGALLAYPFGDRLGRRWGVIVACAIFSVGVALQTASTTIPVFAVGRVFAGLGVGMTSCLVPMYQSECAPKWIRGAVVACYQWAITIGLLVAAIVVNATKDIDNASAYRIPIGIQFVWAVILSLGLYILPESPKYLILKGREEEAKNSLARLLSIPATSPQVLSEYEEVCESLRAERALGTSTYADCFKSGPGRYRLRTLTGMGIQALQQLTGINFIFYYGTTFFQNSGISNAFTITIITNVVNVVMTIPGIWLVDKAGRRSLLLTGAAVMCVCEFIVAIIGLKLENSNIAGQRALISLVCIYIGAFAATWEFPVTHHPIFFHCRVVTSEIYPLAIRAKAMSMSTASNWALNFAIGYSTPYLVDVGEGKAGLRSNVFFIWGACCGFIPETKGLSLEQVDQLYMNSSIVGSNAYRQRLVNGEFDTHHATTPLGSIAEDDHGDKLSKVA
ncbi:hypothetical protein PSHT_05080 [Puccinia striiformis]|uniref:Major facilitator superfamily (MFS) profile domain-containing protein n=1 Tax=Puccinia striiformis TaxID=27350 RepID=A0A2S4WBG0_9BASI|nr:hypothetical protein PSHT_05080 [Puccinia striiformis]